MMNPTGNGGGTSWLFSGPTSGPGGFHHTDPNHSGLGHLPTSSSTFNPTAAFDDGRGGQQHAGQPPPMIPFTQSDLSFVDSLTQQSLQHPTQV
jgi:hypothetical protein